MGYQMTDKSNWQLNQGYVTNNIVTFPIAKC